MKLSDRLWKLLDGKPDEASVTLPVTTLREWMDETGPGGFEPDLTTQEVADLLGRSPARVRAWIRDGLLRGYRFHNREWRVPRSDLEEFCERQRS